METNRAAEVLQAVLDDRRLAGFLHPEVPGRVPVRVVWNMAGPRIDGVVKFDQPVEVGRSKYAEDAAVIELGTFLVLNKEAWVSLRYPIEGVYGEFHLREGADGWGVVDGDVGEQ